MYSGEFEKYLLEWLLTPRRGQSSNSSPSGRIASAASPRRADNQDRAVIAMLPDGSTVAALADGMGGMRDGAGCSARALAAVLAQLVTEATAPPRIRMQRAVAHANKAVYETYLGEGGTTLTLLLVTQATALADAQAWMAHAGDSRLYALWGNGARQLSSDDTALAALPPEQRQGLSARQRMALGSQLRCAVGVDAVLSPAIVPVAGKTFLLTSDGLHDFAGEALAAVNPDAEPDYLLDNLLQAAAVAGTHDDATAVCLRLDAMLEPATELLVWDAYDHARFGTQALD